ncbi:MAG: MBL fold metallo-hydrolase [Frankia sp.]|nr:MBL fold metallo-hydrolase [Frankia sp.]
MLTRGEFTLDGRRAVVDNNVWLVGDDEEVLVIDAAHDPAVIVAAVDGRRVAGIVATHGHNDHINAAVELADLVRAPIALHRADHMLWQAIYPNRRPDRALVDGARIPIAGGVVLRVLHTPGHSPGGVCLLGTFPTGPVLFSGDTLLHGGPGTTDCSYADFPTILGSVRRLLALPPQTRVHAGHGPDTTIGEEAAGYDGWAARGPTGDDDPATD